MSSRSNIRVTFVFLLCFFAASSLRAQGVSPAAGTPKIGVINIQQAISSTAEGKQAAAELETQFGARQQELDSLNKQLNDVRQRLNSGSNLTDEQRENLSVQGTRISQRLERKNTEFNEDLNAAQLERVNEIGRKMVVVINRFASEGGYLTIFDSSAQNSPVLFASKSIDVTQDIVRLYDQSNPAKTAAAAPAAKPKP